MARKRKRKPKKRGPKEERLKLPAGSWKGHLAEFLKVPKQK
jgi:hypothetical protein